MSATLSVVIPAFNEADRLPRYLDEVTAYLSRELGDDWEVIVVDDGSNDATADVAERHGASVIRFERNLGKGAAVREGMLRAKGAFCLFADADGATPIAEEIKLRRMIEAGADVVIGSRTQGGTRRLLEKGTSGDGASRWNVRFYRHLVRRVFSALIRSIMELPFRDTQCGFKMFRHQIVHPLWSQLETTGFAFDVELLLKARELGLRVEEIGVRWSEKTGAKVRVATDSIRMLKEVLRMKSSRA